MGFWNKKIKNAGIIADKIGVSEEKIRELKNGEREITGETMEKVLKAVNETSEAEMNIKKANIAKWYQENDIKKLTGEFGYSNYKELGNVVGLSNSTISQLASNTINRLSPAGIKLYLFFQDEFNKKTRKVDTVEKGLLKISDEEAKEIEKWYQENDIKNKIKEFGYKSYSEIGEKIGISKGTIAQLNCGGINRMSGAGLKLYLFFKDENNNKCRQNLDETNENISEGINIPEDIETSHNDEIKPISDGVKESGLVEDNIQQENTNNDEYCRLVKENERLKRQIAMYEKLIERL